MLRKGFIRNPTGADDTRITIWILGGIDRTKEKSFFRCRVTDRTINSLIATMMPNINDISILFTDGHPLYPSVVRNLNFRHHIINHSEGFRSGDGAYTNNIEGLCVIEKYYEKENGVFRDHIDACLIQYTFKRRYNLNKRDKEFFKLFIHIFKTLF